ncbi:MAG: hypothetical protein ACRECP_00580 [Methylocella sp.]
MSDLHFPNTKKLALGQDNAPRAGTASGAPRNIDRSASLCEAFPAADAGRPAERFERHYTPEHGGWLDMAASELGVLAPQCLDRRILDKQILCGEICAWGENRNLHHTRSSWRFTTEDARVKLAHLYPLF